MTAIQMSITIAVCTAATMLTRFLPFVVFSSKDQQPPEVVRYLAPCAMCCWCSWYSDRKKLPRHGALPWAEELFAQ